MKGNSVDWQNQRRKHVDIGSIGTEQTGRKGKTRATLQPHLADQRTGETMGNIVYEKFLTSCVRQYNPDIRRPIASPVIRLDSSA